MARAFISLAALLLAAGCAVHGAANAPLRQAGDGSLPEFAPCRSEQADQWAAEQALNARLRAAGCFARLAEAEPDAGRGLAWAKKGQRLARDGAEQYPANATAHYLAAYLTGLAAEREPVQGLSLVPIIQEQARVAAELSPSLDNGGPHRILGELLLQAPGFPVSIGDPFAAVEHFREAVRLAPDHVDNRLGWAESLLETDQGEQACRVLEPVWKFAQPSNISSASWKRALRLFNSICKRIPSESGGE
ncbi:MAG: hypothetical protein AB7D07_14815 [Desulfovibrionaceae bacterium]